MREPFLRVRQRDARNCTLCNRGTRRECARNNAVRIPAPLCLCRVFQLVRPSELRTYRWHHQGCRECPRATSGKNPSSASRTLFLAKGHAVQRPSRLASSAPQTTRLQVRPFRRLPSASRSARLGSRLSPPNALQSYPEHATRAGLTLTDRIQLFGSFRSLPTPALSIVPEIVFAPDGAQTLRRRTSRQLHRGPSGCALRAMARGLARGGSAVHGDRVWPV